MTTGALSPATVTPVASRRRTTMTGSACSPAALNDLVSSVVLQAEAVEVLARDVVDISGVVETRLQEAAEHLVDTAWQLVAVRHRLTRSARSPRLVA